MSFASAREKAGMTQKEVASSLGVTTSAVSVWEVGKATPKGRNLRNLAKLYGITVDELLYDGKASQEVCDSMICNSASDISKQIEASAQRVGDAANKMVSMVSMLNLTSSEFRRAFEIAIDFVPHEHTVK